MNCVHCYLKNLHSEHQLTTQRVFEILDILHDNSILFLTLTGGEILTRSDFAEIYMYAKRKGFFVELFTNAYLFNDDTIELLKKYPPMLVDVSLYGGCEETCYKITGIKGAFRKVLEAEGEKSLVLRKDVFQKCLVLYPESVWNEQLDGLRSQVDQWNSREQMALRRFEADAEPIELDKNGRLLISKRKLQYAGIESDVRFLAMVDRIEIWNKEALEEALDSSVDLGDEMEALFSKPREGQK